MGTIVMVSCEPDCRGTDAGAHPVRMSRITKTMFDCFGKPAFIGVEDTPKLTGNKEW